MEDINEKSHTLPDKLHTYASLFGATQSILEGRLNYSTLALILEQTLTMTTEAFHDRLDYIYSTISYDEFAFIECIHKINLFVNTNTQQSEATRNNLLNTVASLRSAISEEQESDEIILSPFPKNSWRSKLQGKPAKISTDEAVSRIVREIRRTETPEPSAGRLGRLLSAVFGGRVVVDGDEIFVAEIPDCGDPNCPGHRMN